MTSSWRVITRNFWPGTWRVYSLKSLFQGRKCGIFYILFVIVDVESDRSFIFATTGVVIIMDAYLSFISQALRRPTTLQLKLSNAEDNARNELRSRKTCSHFDVFIWSSVWKSRWVHFSVGLIKFLKSFKYTVSLSIGLVWKLKTCQTLLLKWRIF